MLEDLINRGRRSAERQLRQIQSGRIVKIDRSSLPWTVSVEFATSHNSYTVDGITFDPLFNLADTGAIFILPRNAGDGAEEGTEASSVTLEAARGEADEAGSIVQWRADFGEPDLSRAKLQFPGAAPEYLITPPPTAWLVLPATWTWEKDGPAGGTETEGVQPHEASVNATGKEVNLYVGKANDIKATALRVWLEPTPDGYGRVNIMYGVDPNVVPAAARRVADIPLVHPDAVDETSEKIRSGVAIESDGAPIIETEDQGLNTRSASGPGSHAHGVPDHAHPLTVHYHEIETLAVNPIRVWYVE